MKIYRFENGDGYGPYQSSDGKGRFMVALYQDAVAECGFGWEYSPYNSDHCPTPMKSFTYDDENLARVIHTDGTRGLHYGCGSKGDLLDWFLLPEGREAMAEAGCVAVELDVPDQFVIIGRKQVAFRRDKATAKVQLNPVTLEQLK